MNDTWAALRDAIATAYMWYLGPEADDAWFAAYADTFPQDIREGLYAYHSGGMQALSAYLEEIA